MWNFSLMQTRTNTVKAETKMLRKITVEFGAAVRVIAAENLNLLRSFVKDVTNLLSRLGPVQKETRNSLMKRTDLERSTKC